MVNISQMNYSQQKCTYWSFQNFRASSSRATPVLGPMAAPAAWEVKPRQRQDTTRRKDSNKTTSSSREPTFRLISKLFRLSDGTMRCVQLRATSDTWPLCPGCSPVQAAHFKVQTLAILEPVEHRDHGYWPIRGLDTNHWPMRGSAGLHSKPVDYHAIFGDHPNLIQ